MDFAISTEPDHLFSESTEPKQKKKEKKKMGNVIRDDIRRFGKFIGWMDINLRHLGLEDLRPKLTVGKSNEASIFLLNAE